MPAAIDHSKPPTDWELIQSMFVNGLSPSKIILRLGPDCGVTENAIACKASKRKWKRLVSFVRQEQTAGAVQALKHERDAIQKASEIARKGLSDELLEQISHLAVEVKRGSSLKNVIGRAQVTRTLAETGKTVYGWDSSDAKRTIINVAVLDQLDEQGVIDVAPDELGK